MGIGVGEGFGIGLASAAEDSGHDMGIGQQIQNL